MTKIVRNLLIISLIQVSSSDSFGQNYFYNNDYYESAITWSTGFSGGGINCLTDLGGNKGVGRKFVKDINWNNTRPYGSFFAGATYKEIIGARLELAFGQVRGSDDVLKNDKSAAYGRFLRNLNFRSSIREISFAVELYPFSIFQAAGKDPPVINPYIFAGIGSFNFNPETYFNNSWTEVADLHTEGQGFPEYPERKPYSLTQFNIPLGLGLHYEVSPVLNFQLEIMYRKLWTDYLDDVSKTYIDPRLFEKYIPGFEVALAKDLADRRLTNDPNILKTAGGIRGNDKNNDAYFSGAIRIVFIMGRQKR